MRAVANILILLLMMFFSCKTGNGPGSVSSSEMAKEEKPDNLITTSTNSDNYLLDNSENQSGGPVYMYCEVMPVFPGGDTAFSDYMRRHIKYPLKAVAQKTEGRVVMKFIVSSGGKVSEVKVLRSINKELDEACLKAFNGMPDWTPGTINKNPVAVSYSIPVRFSLSKSENLNGVFILP
jgi:TonB family protein